MIELLMMLHLGSAVPAVLTAQVQPCVWPNTCRQETAVQTAQVQPCVWPNRCARETLTLAQFQPCVLPNRCAAESLLPERA